MSGVQVRSLSTVTHLFRSTAMLVKGQDREVAHGKGNDYPSDPNERELGMYFRARRLQCLLGDDCATA